MGSFLKQSIFAIIIESASNEKLERNINMSKPSRSSFLRGMGSVINLYPEHRDNSISLPQHSTEEALRKDWETVGNDMWTVLDRENGTDE